MAWTYCEECFEKSIHTRCEVHLESCSKRAEAERKWEAQEVSRKAWLNSSEYRLIKGPRR